MRQHRRPPGHRQDREGQGCLAEATEQPIDTSTAAGKCFLDMLGVFAEFETNLRRERQLEGIAKAKAAGVYKGAAEYVCIRTGHLRAWLFQGGRKHNL
jgi:DNA invertase Pin-like site-specific DNA recombinase